MKVIHVSTATSWRGGEQQIVYLMDYLLGENIEQYILCPAGSPLEAYCKPKGYKVISFLKKNSLGINGSKLLATVCKQKPDIIIHVHDSHGHTLAFLSSLIFGNPSPIIVHRRVDFAVSDSFFSKWKYNYRGIKKYICVSQAIQSILSKNLKKPSIVEVVYDGIDFTRFNDLPATNILRSEFGIGAEYFLVGNVSALADHKDYPTFIKTAHLLCQQSDRFRFVIIGEGHLRNELENLTQELHLSGKVFFAGFRKNVPFLLKELDILFMPSKTEGLGSSILDAFVSKLPVVATYAGGIPELIEHEKTGLLAQIGDCDLLAEHIKRIQEDEKLRKIMVDNAFEKARLFDYKNTGQTMLSIYRQVLMDK